MVVCIKTEEVDSDATPPAQTRNTSLADILVPKGSPSSLNTDRNVVFVTDALEEFPWRRFQWILDHVIPPDCTVTLLGVMPWIPLACKILNYMHACTFVFAYLYLCYLFYMVSGWVFRVFKSPLKLV